MKFKYLGSIIWQDSEIDDEVNHGVQAKWCKWIKAIGFLCDIKYYTRQKESFIALLLERQYYMVVNIKLRMDNMNIKLW